MSTHNIHLHDKTCKMFLNICFLEISEEFCRDSKNKYKFAMVNKPSVSELLRFDCK